MDLPTHNAPAKKYGHQFKGPSFDRILKIRSMLKHCLSTILNHNALVTEFKA